MSTITFTPHAPAHTSVKEVEPIVELTDEAIPLGTLPHVFPVNHAVYDANYTLFKSPSDSFQRFPQVKGELGNTLIDSVAERVLSLSTRTTIFSNQGCGPLMIFPTPEEIMARVLVCSRDESKLATIPGVPLALLQKPLPIPHHAPGLGTVILNLTSSSLLYGLYSPNALVAFITEFPELAEMIGEELVLLLREVGAISDPKSVAAERIMIQCFMAVLRRELEAPKDSASKFKAMMSRAVARKTAFEAYMRTEGSRPVTDNPPEDTCLAKQQFALLCSMVLDETFFTRVLETDTPYLDQLSLFAPFFLMVRGLRPGLSVYIPPGWPIVFVKGSYLAIQSSSSISLPHALGPTPLCPMIDTPLAHRLDVFRDLFTQMAFGPQLDVGRNGRVLLQGYATNSLSRYYTPPPAVRHMEICFARLPKISKREVTEPEPEAESDAEGDELMGETRLMQPTFPIPLAPDPDYSVSGWVSWGCGLVRNAGTQLTSCTTLRESICTFIFQVGSREEVLNITTEPTEDAPPNPEDDAPPPEPDVYKGQIILSASIYHTALLGIEGEAVLRFSKMDETNGQEYPPEPVRPSLLENKVYEDEEEEEEEGSEKNAAIELGGLQADTTVKYDKSWIGWSSASYEKRIRPGDMVLIPPGFTVTAIPLETDDCVVPFSMIKVGAAASSAPFPESFPLASATNHPVDPAFLSTFVRPFYPYRCPIPDGSAIEKLPRYLIDLIQATSVVGCIDCVYRIAIPIATRELPELPKLRFELPEALTWTKLTGIDTIREKPLDLGWASPLRGKFLTERVEALDDFRETLLEKELPQDSNDVFEVLSRAAMIGARLEELEEGWPGVNWLWRGLHAQLMSMTFLLFSERTVNDMSADRVTDCVRSLACSILTLEAAVECLFNSSAASSVLPLTNPYNPTDGSGNLVALLKSHFGIIAPHGLAFQPILVKPAKFRKRAITQIADYISNFAEDNLRMNTFKKLLHQSFVPFASWVSAVRWGELSPQGTIVPARVFMRNVSLICSQAQHVVSKIVHLSEEGLSLSQARIDLCAILRKKLEVLETLVALCSTQESTGTDNGFLTESL